MFAGGFLRSEQTSAFQRDVNAHFVPRQIRWIALGNNFNALAADINACFGGFYWNRQLAMHGVVLQHMCIIGNGTQIVNGDNIDIFAAAFDNPAQYEAPNAPEPVNCYVYSHALCPFLI